MFIMTMDDKNSLRNLRKNKKRRTAMVAVAQKSKKFESNTNYWYI